MPQFIPQDLTAEHVLAVKGDQPTLRRGIEGHFLEQLEDDFAAVAVSRHETKEKGHGRVEHRAYYVCDAPADLPDRERWKGLAAIGMVINISMHDGNETSENIGVKYKRLVSACNTRYMEKC